MVRTVAVITVLLASSLASGAAFAQTQFRPPSSPDERACRGDARRYCKEFFPDQFRVLSCLQSHRARLSRACRGVLDSHGQ